MWLKTTRNRWVNLAHVREIERTEAARYLLRYADGEVAGEARISTPERLEQLLGDVMPAASATKVYALWFDDTDVDREPRVEVYPVIGWRRDGDHPDYMPVLPGDMEFGAMGMVWAIELPDGRFLEVFQQVHASREAWIEETKASLKRKPRAEPGPPANDRTSP